MNKNITTIPSEEGITHINVRIEKEIDHTKLGHRLAIDYPFEFNHPSLGPFHSIEAFWKYIITYGADDELREASKLKPINYNKRKWISNNSQDLEFFYGFINDAVLHRLLADEELVNELKVNTLPFACYRVFKGNAGDIATEVTAMRFYVSALEYAISVIREEVEHVEPSYKEFLVKANKI